MARWTGGLIQQHSGMQAKRGRRSSPQERAQVAAAGELGDHKQALRRAQGRREGGKRGTGKNDARVPAVQPPGGSWPQPAAGLSRSGVMAAPTHLVPVDKGFIKS